MGKPNLLEIIYRRWFVAVSIAVALQLQVQVHHHQRRLLQNCKPAADLACTRRMFVVCIHGRDASCAPRQSIQATNKVRTIAAVGTPACSITNFTLPVSRIAAPPTVICAGAPCRMVSWAQARRPTTTAEETTGARKCLSHTGYLFIDS